MPYELYLEAASFTVAAIFTKDDKSKLSKTATAKPALVKSKLTVAKKTPKTKELHAWRRIDRQGEGRRCEGDGGDSRNASAWGA